MSQLRERIMAQLDSFSIRLELKIPYRDAEVLSYLHALGRVRSRRYESDGTRLQVDVPRSASHGLRQYLVRDSG
jgi:50S ribosomal subunit-associated GTPase HflX